MSSRRRNSTAQAPQLGEISFDDWFETPVFEEEPDERIEQLAISKRAPLRLLAGAALRLAPDFPARPARPSRSWRDRADDLLDRWAETEAAWQERLEGLMLPRRWRA